MLLVASFQPLLESRASAIISVLLLAVMQSRSHTPMNRRCAAAILLTLTCEPLATQTKAQVANDPCLSAWNVSALQLASTMKVLTADGVKTANTDSATAVVTRMPMEHDLRAPEALERQRMLDLISFVRGVRSAQRNLAQLTTAEVNTLIALVNDHYDRPATWAQNILCFHYAHCRPPQTGGEDNSHRPLPYTPRTAGSIKAEPTLTAFPNPGTNYMAFEVRLLTEPRNAMLVIRDIAGREVHRLRLRQQQGQLIWDARHAPAGSYTVTLFNNGAQIKTQKFILRP